MISRAYGSASNPAQAWDTASPINSPSSSRNCFTSSYAASLPTAPAVRTTAAASRSLKLSSIDDSSSSARSPTLASSSMSSWLSGGSSLSVRAATSSRTVRSSSGAWVRLPAASRTSRCPWTGSASARSSKDLSNVARSSGRACPTAICTTSSHWSSWAWRTRTPKSRASTAAFAPR
ncbi:hypothetical protein OG752_31115 [Streptomyces anulatus]